MENTPIKRFSERGATGVPVILSAENTALAGGYAKKRAANYWPPAFEFN
jgi:hypothetical protein